LVLTGGKGRKQAQIVERIHSNSNWQATFPRTKIGKMQSGLIENHRKNTPADDNYRRNVQTHAPNKQIC